MQIVNNMGSRRKAREVALQVLYQLDVADGRVDDVLETMWDNFNLPQEIRDYSGKLVRSIYQHLGEIDRGIESASENWSLDRMAIIDRNILRLGAFELIYCEDVPFKVAIDEAVELGKRYGSEDSGAFINGVLDRLAKATHPEGRKGLDRTYIKNQKGGF